MGNILMEPAKQALAKSAARVLPEAAIELTVPRRVQRFFNQYLSREPLGRGESLRAFRRAACLFDASVATGLVLKAWETPVPIMRQAFGAAAVTMMTALVMRQILAPVAFEEGFKSLGNAKFLPFAVVASACLSVFVLGSSYPRFFEEPRDVVGRTVWRDCKTFISRGRIDIVEDSKNTELHVVMAHAPATVGVALSSASATVEQGETIPLSVTGSMTAENIFGRIGPTAVDQTLYLELKAIRDPEMASGMRRNCEVHWAPKQQPR